MDSKWLFVAFNMFSTFNGREVESIISYARDEDNIFKLSFIDLKNIGVSNQKYDHFITKLNPMAVDLEIVKAEKASVDIITFQDKRYPKLLKSALNPPKVLYLKGNKDILDFDYRIAIVGSRKCTNYGRYITEKFAQELAAAKFVIVSGMAIGIDSIANATALKVSGRSIGVVAQGLNLIYPKQNKFLFDKMYESGLIISENPMDMEVTKYNLKNRNRIISGLSSAVLITEAALKSGSLITAKFATSQSREVFAVPGNITSEMSRGTNTLIKYGAKIALTPDDILDDFEIMFDKKDENIQMTDEEKKIVGLISQGFDSFDSLFQKSSIEISELSSLLMNLEMKDFISQDINGRYFLKLDFQSE